MIITPQEIKAILAFTSSNKKDAEILKTVYVDRKNSKLIATDSYSLLVIKSKDEEDIKSVDQNALSYYINKSTFKFCGANEAPLHIDLNTGKVSDNITGFTINSINIKGRDTYDDYPVDLDRIFSRSDIMATNCIYSLDGFEKIRKLISLYSPNSELFLTLKSRNTDFISFEIESNRALIQFAVAAQYAQGANLLYPKEGSEL